jgi:hypothetical protein
MMPRQLSLIATGVMLATLAFMVFSKFVMDVEFTTWAIPVMAVVFAVVIALCFFLKHSVKVDPEGVKIVHAVSRMTIPMEEIIDNRTGELALIRSYDRWNLKGVKHKAYCAVGDDNGVAMKLTGKRVVVVSVIDPEAMAALLPKDTEE